MASEWLRVISASNQFTVCFDVTEPSAERRDTKLYCTRRSIIINITLLIIFANIHPSWTRQNHHQHVHYKSASLDAFGTGRVFTWPGHWPLIGHLSLHIGAGLWYFRTCLNYTRNARVLDWYRSQYVMIYVMVAARSAQYNIKTGLICQHSLRQTWSWDDCRQPG